MTRLASRHTTMPGIERPRPSRNSVVAVYIRIGGMPSANITSTRPPPAAIAGLLAEEQQDRLARQQKRCEQRAEDARH